MPIRVILAQPEDRLASAYVPALSEQGFEIATVSTLHACLSALAAGDPDALVLDPNLPGSCDEVLELSSRLLGQDGDTRFPVIALCAEPAPFPDNFIPLNAFHPSACPPHELGMAIRLLLGADMPVRGDKVCPPAVAAVGTMRGD